MKKSNFLFLMFASLIVCFSCSQSFGQDEMPLNTDTQKLNNLRRRGVLEELNLSQTQVREIRRINQEKRFSLRQAQTRLREANKNLDAAIYDDSFDERDIQSKIKELQLAQAEMIKLRSSTELAIRRLLEPAQLSKFREVRRNFIQKAEGQPLERLNRQMNLRNRRFSNRGRRN